MQFRNLPIDILKSIKPNFLKNYALSSGWERVGELPNKFFIYKHIVNGNQLLVPVDVTFDDYYRRISDALEVIAAVEKRPITSILNDVFTPNVDVIRYRLVGQEYENGTAPLGEGLSLISGSKKSLFVSALQVQSPKKFYKRLRNSEAEDFLNKCRLGQTERGSFITTLVCPIGIRTPEQTNLLNEPNQTEPYATFTRKVTANFLKGLYLIKKAIDDDNLDVLKEGDIPLISSNFCDAIVEMKPQNMNSSLDVGIKFSTKDSIPPINGIVSLRADYFSEIEQISRGLRPQFESETETIFAKVDACLGQPNEYGEMEGEVTLTFIDEDIQAKAKVNLTASHYQMAVEAHRTNRYVKIVGEYLPATKIGRIENYSDFIIQN
jgi:hypothetical protein